MRILSDKRTRSLTSKMTKTTKSNSFSSRYVPRKKSYRARKNKSYKRKAKHIFQRIHKQTNAAVLLSPSDEVIAVSIQSRLGNCITEFVGPALRNFLVASQMVRNDSVTDVFEYLKLLISRYNRDPSILPSTTVEQLKTAFNGRNSVEHGYLPNIFHQWLPIINSWINVLTSANELSAAENVALLRNFMVTKFPHTNKICGESTCSTFSTSTTQRSLNGYRQKFLQNSNENSGIYDTKNKSKRHFKNANPKTTFKKPNPNHYRHVALLSAAEEERAIYIEKVLRRCLMEHIGPALRTFLVSKSIVQQDSHIDISTFLKTITRKYRNDQSFLHTPNDQTHASMLKQLQWGAEGRNAVAHGNKPHILYEWQVYLDSWKDILTSINQTDAANKIKDTLETMVANLKILFQ